MPENLYLALADAERKEINFRAFWRTVKQLVVAISIGLGFAAFFALTGWGY